MGLINNGQGSPSIDVAIAAQRIRRQYTQTARQLEQVLDNVKHLTDAVGKAELIAELGDDGAELETIYNAYKTALETVTEVTIEPL
jgi:hypothetical protein